MKAFLIILLLVILISVIFYFLFGKLFELLDDNLSVEIEDIDEPLI